MQGKMRQDLYQELYEVENNHWWHLHKRATVHQLINKYGKKGVVLDVGSGTGKILEELKQDNWKVYGIDGEEEAVKWSEQRNIKIVKIDFTKQALPFKDNTFDVVLALDILEHLPNDKEVAKEMYRVLKPGGIAVITVPAYQWFFSYWDKMLGHQRRYTSTTVDELLNTAGFKSEYVSYYFCLALIPALVVRLFKQVVGQKNITRSDFQDTPFAPFSVQLLKVYTAFERRLIRSMNLSFGLSVIGVGKKKYS